MVVDVEEEGFLEEYDSNIYMVKILVFLPKSRNSFQ